MMVGDGLWGTITALGSYDLRFADPLTGQVGFFGTVTETTDTSAFTLRLKVENGAVAEAETLVVRQADSGIKFEGQAFENKPVLNEILPVAQRSPRAKMITLADGYFDTLQLNDGTLFTKFAAQLRARGERREDHAQPGLHGHTGIEARLRGAVQDGLLPLQRPPARPALPAGG